jgi:hypothetical protein
MRNVLVDFAPTHSALIRAGGPRRIEMQEDLAITLDRLEELMWFDEALTRLAEANPCQARVVELRYFGALSVDEIGRVLRRLGAVGEARLVARPHLAASASESRPSRTNRQSRLGGK